MLNSSLYQQAEAYLTHLKNTQPINEKDTYMWFRDKVLLINLLLLSEEAYFKKKVSKTGHNIKALNPKMWTDVTNYFLGRYLPSLLEDGMFTRELEALKSSLKSVPEAFNEIKGFFDWINKEHPNLHLVCRENCFMLRH